MNWEGLVNIVDEVSALAGAPGASIAVGNGREIVFEYAHGVADVLAGERLTTDHLFRVGSLSKLLTGAALAKLVGSRTLFFEQRLGDLLPGLTASTCVDDRVPYISLRHLLQMRLAFDDQSEVFNTYAALVGQVGRKDRIPVDYVIDLLRRTRLRQPAGAQWTWNLLTYTILGRIVEHHSNLPYETFVKRVFADTANCPDLEIGALQPKYRIPGEVTYHVKDGALLDAPDYLGIDEKVSPPYREQIVQLRDSNGGWVARPRDFVSVVMKTFDPDDGVLRRGEIHLMERRPTESPPSGTDYFTSGLLIKTNARYTPLGPKRYHQHDWSAVGGLVGCLNYAGRRRDGLTWTFSSNGTYNTRDFSDLYRLFGISFWEFFAGREQVSRDAISAAKRKAATV